MGDVTADVIFLRLFAGRGDVIEPTIRTAVPLPCSWHNTDRPELTLQGARVYWVDVNPPITENLVVSASAFRGQLIPTVEALAVYDQDLSVGVMSRQFCGTTGAGAADAHAIAEKFGSPGEFFAANAMRAQWKATADLISESRSGRFPSLRLVVKYFGR